MFYLSIGEGFLKRAWGKNAQEKTLISDKKYVM
jgi:hypothetical protein